MPNPKKALDIGRTLADFIGTLQDSYDAGDDYVTRSLLPEQTFRSAGDQAIMDTAEPVLGAAANRIGPRATQDLIRLLTLQGAIPKMDAIQAYHGTPHLFDKYDASKIGTGEGAQAYGHGFYFAENPATAAEYRRRLARAEAPTVETLREYYEPGKVVPYGSGKARVLEFDPGGQAEDSGVRSWSARLQRVDKAGNPITGERPTWTFTEPSWKEIDQTLGPGYAPGAVQSVTLRPDKTDLLDWDKPLSQQNEKVKKALESGRFLHSDDWKLTAGEWYEAAAAGRNGDWSPDALSEALSESGIPGIKYLDQGSRGAGEGTYNFVIFNPDDIVVDSVNGYQLAPGSSRVSPFVGPHRPGAWVDEAKPVKPDPLLDLVTTLEKARRGEATPAPPGSFREALESYESPFKQYENVEMYPFKTAGASRSARTVASEDWVKYYNAREGQNASRHGLTPQRAQELGVMPHDIPMIGSDIDLFHKELRRADSLGERAKRGATKRNPADQVELAAMTLDRIERFSKGGVDTSEMRRMLMRYRARYGQ